MDTNARWRLSAFRGIRREVLIPIPTYRSEIVEVDKGKGTGLILSLYLYLY